MNNLGDVSSEELLARLRTHVGKGHVWQAGLIAYLAEVEHRNLHLEHACSSMWDFCVRKLGMSESESHRRIAAARVVQRFPLALEYLERGDVHLCAISALRHHLTPENHEELLREATGKSTRAVAEMIAARYPKPDVAACIEPVAPQTSLPIAPACAEQVAARVASESFGGSVQRIEPLSATRYRVELTISSDTKAKLERIRDLMSHRNPSGDLETILDASLDLLLEKLEKERLGKTSRPRSANSRTNKVASDTTASPATNDSSAASTTTNGSVSPADERQAAHSRDISRETLRAVFTRDGEQCTYEDAEGNRCPARAYLELDHVHPKAFGGSNTAENLRVRCRPHNALYAQQVFGRAYVEKRIELRRRKSGTETRLPILQTTASALRNMGFKEPEVRRALAIVETKVDIGAASIEKLIRECLAVLT